MRGSYISVLAYRIYLLTFLYIIFYPSFVTAARSQPPNRNDDSNIDFNWSSIFMVKPYNPFKSISTDIPINILEVVSNSSIITSPSAGRVIYVGNLTKSIYCVRVNYGCGIDVSFIGVSNVSLVPNQNLTSGAVIGSVSENEGGSFYGPLYLSATLNNSILSPLYLVPIGAQKRRKYTCNKKYSFLSNKNIEIINSVYKNKIYNDAKFCYGALPVISKAMYTDIRKQSDIKTNNILSNPVDGPIINDIRLLNSINESLPDFLDIGYRYTKNSVKSADAGKVMYVGDEIRSRGVTILIRHSGGIITIYHPLRNPLVKRNDLVKRGQPIAEGVSSYGGKEEILWFEVRVGHEAVDPRAYLEPVELDK